MDDLLSEFLTETAENLDVVDVELVKFERNPNDKDVLDKIFRLVHTIKGTCGFLGLPRLEAVAHASETLLGKFRDGALAVSPEAVTLVLESLDHIKVLLAQLEADEKEPEGNDSALIARLDAASEGKPIGVAANGDAPQAEDPASDDASSAETTGGNASLEALEAAFHAAPGPEDLPAAPVQESAIETAPGSALETAPESALGATKNDSHKRESQIANQSIRVNVEVIENLMTMVSELVLTRNQLLEMVRHLDDSEFKVPLQRLSNVTAELQEEVMKTRMQPIGNAWQKLPRIIRDLSQELGKKINLEMQGAETELDRQVLEMIKDPLTHMVRNSADHGLEMPADRKAKGKSETGTIRLRAYHEGGHIIIEVGDDGRGLDVEKIKAKAVANGLVSEAAAETLSEQQLQKFIFHAGFSTAAAVTSVSGRGVGMDVVRSNIELIGGTIDLKSTLNKGTVFTIKIPLTLAIVSALIVESAGQRFAMPQLSVLELVRTKAGSDNRIEQINKTPVLRLRNRLLPLLFLDKELGLRPADQVCDDKEAFIIVTQVGAQIFGIVVDGVFDTEEIVVKPVATILRDITLFSGNTILGDGSVIMIVDPNGMAARIGAGDVEAAEAEAEARKTVGTDDDEAVSLLVFRAGGSEPKAVPLSLVTRLEEIEVERIERANGRMVVQYRGKLMPVVHVTGGMLAGEGRQPILVFTDEDRAMGLAVDEIVDIVEDRLSVELPAETRGMLGTAIVKGKATEILDVGYFLTQAFDDWFERKPEDLRAGKRRVLLIDDSPFFRNMITPLLSSAGYAVTAAASPEEAWRLKENGLRVDAIVSDIEMPGTDGLDFADAVRKDESWGALPLIALSSYGDADMRRRGQDVGFDEYVSKSERERLVGVLTHIIQARRTAA